MKFFRRSNCIAPAIAAAAFITLSPLSVQADDKVLAKVDGKAITEDALAFAEEEIGEGLAHLSPGQQRRYLTEYLIEMQIFAEAAEKQKLGSGSDFDARMAYWRQHALKDSYLAKAVADKVTEAEAKTFYEERAKQMATEDEVKASHILVQSQDEANKIAKQLIDGGDFAKLAAEHSIDPGSKTKGGELGFFGRGQMVKEFELVAFTMEKGETSQPVKTKYGYHIIRIDDRRKKDPPKFDDVKDEILKRMGQQKKIEEAQLLRAKAKVEYVDPAVKKQVEQDKVAAEARKKAMEAQMKAQVEQMKAKSDADAKKDAKPAEEKK